MIFKTFCGNRETISCVYRVCNVRPCAQQSAGDAYVADSVSFSFGFVQMLAVEGEAVFAAHIKRL